MMPQILASHLITRKTNILQQYQCRVKKLCKFTIFCQKNQIFLHFCFKQTLVKKFFVSVFYHLTDK